MDTFTQPKITGYRQLSEADALLMNEIKAHGEQTRVLILKLQGAQADGRWIAIGQTNLQQGFMALTRSVAKPEGF